MAFPTNPVNNQTAVINGIVYIYDVNKDAWTRVSSTASNQGGVLQVSQEPFLPVLSPDRVNIWVDSDNGRQYIYIDDGNSQQWVELGGGTQGATGVPGATGSPGGATGATGLQGATGVTGLVSRSTHLASTASLAAAASSDMTIAAFAGYNLYKIQVSNPAWVRLYTNQAARTADQSRSQGVDPTADVGIITEVITTTTNQTVTLSPAVLGFNDENPVTSNIAVRVTNTGTTSNIITVTLTLVRTEV